MTTTRRRVTVEGRELSLLEREGTDPPVLWLHGWGASAATFALPLGLCRTGRRLLALDLPGFGESPRGGEVWTSAGYAELIRRLARQEGWEGASLVGHSYGGQVAIRLAAEPGLELDRLVLCAAAGLRLPAEAGVRTRARLFRLLRAMTAPLPARLSGPARERLRQRLGSADYRAAGEMRPTLVAAVTEDVSDLAARITLPTLIIWGERDPELPPERYGARLSQLIESSALVRFPASGHFPFLDEPGRFAAVLDSFLEARL